MGNGVGLLSWILVGVLSGCTASVIARTKQGHDWRENVLVGTIGALVGGVPFALLTHRQAAVDWNRGSFVLAVIGALLLLVVLQRERRG